MIRITLAAMMLMLTPTDKQTLTNNDHVSVEMHVPSALSDSKTAVLQFWMMPNEGIHINTTPMFELRLEKNSRFEIVGIPHFLMNEHEYLDNSRPIEFSIKIKNGTARGTQKLKGVLNYFYCSEKDGWCNRFSQKFEATVIVTQ